MADDKIVQRVIMECAWKVNFRPCAATGFTTFLNWNWILASFAPTIPNRPCHSCRLPNHNPNLITELQYNTIQYNTYLIDHSPWEFFRADETQWTKQQLSRTPTGRRQTSWLFTSAAAREVEPGTTRNKFNEWSERVLNPGSPDLKASALTTGPQCLLSWVVQPYCKL